jgi:hypothetical protein
MPPVDGDLAVDLESPDRDHPTERKAQQLRRYTYFVTAVMMVLCNAIFLLGLWGSGINLDSLVRTPDTFNPAGDVCLRLGWHRVVGIDGPVRLCNEWINLSDPSGETHQFQREIKIVQGADGRLYFDHGARVDYRLFLLVAFVAAVIAFGVILQRYLVARYRLRLEMQSVRM